MIPHIQSMWSPNPRSVAKSSNMKSSSTNHRHLSAVVVLLAMAVTGMAAASELVADVWKDPNCGCCKVWVDHLKEAGITVRVFNTGNTGARARLGIPAKLGSCHTAKINGYVIEGHVPAADIQRLLREKPKAVGLAVPGMPLGSPGMDGPVYGNRVMAYDVLLVQADGSTSVYQSYPGSQ